MITGINHLTLAVHDLNESTAFYRDMLGCKIHAAWDKGAYLSAGRLWLCLTLDPKTRTSPLPEYTHIAFNVRSEDFQTLSNKITDSGAHIWKNNTSEGNSLYFLDPNGHKLEIHTTTLEERIASCKQAPYSDMLFFDESHTSN
ncbi:MAG: fosfomycin resistance glutathione transferase [Gammaproteobacteria bacterium]